MPKPWTCCLSVSSLVPYALDQTGPLRTPYLSFSFVLLWFHLIYCCPDSLSVINRLWDYVQQESKFLDSTNSRSILKNYFILTIWLDTSLGNASSDISFSKQRNRTTKGKKAVGSGSNFHLLPSLTAASSPPAAYGGANLPSLCRTRAEPIYWTFGWQCGSTKVRTNWSNFSYTGPTFWIHSAS